MPNNSFFILRQFSKWHIFSIFRRLKGNIKKPKKKLEKINEYKTEGAIVRARAQWSEFGEKNSRYFLNLEKRNNTRKQISVFRWSDHTGPKMYNGKYFGFLQGSSSCKGHGRY
jgi:hypothetical protein